MDFKDKIFKNYKQGGEVSQGIIQRTFLWLGVILLIVFSVGNIGLAISSTMSIGASLLGLLLIIIISFGYQKMNYMTLSILTLMFAVLQGLGLSGIFASYSMDSIMGAFLGASILFFVMAVYGFITKSDLSKIGNILLVGLISIIILSLLNFFFLHLAILTLIINIVSIVIFLGFVAYDLQALKAMASSGDRRVEILFGVSLFLNFINLFLSLLSIFGNSD